MHSGGGGARGKGGGRLRWDAEDYLIRTIRDSRIVKLSGCQPLVNRQGNFDLQCRTPAQLWIVTGASGTRAGELLRTLRSPGSYVVGRFDEADVDRTQLDPSAKENWNEARLPTVAPKSSLSALLRPLLSLQPLVVPECLLLSRSQCRTSIAAGILLCGGGLLRLSCLGFRTGRGDHSLRLRVTGRTRWALRRGGRARGGRGWS